MKEICKICGKSKPPKKFSPFSNECDKGYSIVLDNGIKHPGFCDSKSQNLPWPPK